MCPCFSAAVRVSSCLLGVAYSIVAPYPPAWLVAGTLYSTYGHTLGNSGHTSTCLACTGHCGSCLQAANAVGYGGSSHQAILDASLVPEGRYSHFVELHIEQVRDRIDVSSSWFKQDVFDSVVSTCCTMSATDSAVSDTDCGALCNGAARMITSHHQSLLDLYAGHISLTPLAPCPSAWLPISHALCSVGRSLLANAPALPLLCSLHSLHLPGCLIQFPRASQHVPHYAGPPSGG